MCICSVPEIPLVTEVIYPVIISMHSSVNSAYRMIFSSLSHSYDSLKGMDQSVLIAQDRYQQRMLCLDESIGGFAVFLRNFIKKHIAMRKRLLSNDPATFG